MFGERKRGKGYISGGQVKEWLGCLKSHLQQLDPNDTTHTTHDTPHTTNPII